MNAKDVLNELKWRENRKLVKATIYYVHRGAPNGERLISGEEIKELGSSFFSTTDATIPYHRIFRIEYEGKTIFERPNK
jgi:uncharacterized protein (UPF0248 family)